MKYAYVINGVVEGLSEVLAPEGQVPDLTQHFHPDYAVKLVLVPEGTEVAQGDQFDGKTFAARQQFPTSEQADAVRLERNHLLTLSDWTQLADIPQATQEAWAPYRQELRNVPQQKGYPQKVKWPEAPQ